MEQQMMVRKHLISCTLLMSMVSILSPAQSWSQLSEQPAKVVLTATALHVLVGQVTDFTAMQVRIQDPTGRLVLNARSTGETISWVPSGTSVDGYYRYEADVFSSQDPTTASPATQEKNEEGTTGVIRQQVSGPFMLKEGLIVVPPPETPKYEQVESRLEVEPWWQTVLSEIGDLLVPPAAAQLAVSGNSPTIQFDDTEDEDCSDIFDWKITGDGGASTLDTNNLFTISSVTEPGPGCGATVPIVTLKHNGTSGVNSSENSLVVEGNGDVALANSQLFINRTTGKVGIGTTTPSEKLQVVGSADIGTTSGGNQELDIVSTVPEVGFVDTDDSTQFGFQYDNKTLTFEGPGAGTDEERAIVSISGVAPVNSLVLTPNGSMGIGTDTPQGRLNVVDNVDGPSYLWAQNPLSGLNAVAVLRAQAGPTNVLNFQAHSPARTIVRFGQVLGGWAELLAVGSNGLAMGSAINIPVIIGTNNVRRILVTAAGVTVFGTFTNSSSRELKEDIRPLSATEAVEALHGLEPVKFRYKDLSEENLGFISEDVPDLVAVEGRKSIAPMDIIALLTKVAKEQQTQLKTQEQTVTKQARTIEELRQTLAAQQQMMAVFQTRLTAVEQQQPAQPQWIKLSKATR